MTVFVDTVYVVALINPRDQYHAKALELAELYEGGRFLVTDAVLLEIGNALARNFKPQAVEVIRHFLTSADVDIVRLTPDLFDEAFALYHTHADQQWGLVDCVSFVVMRRRGVPTALTFDHHFEQAGLQALMR